MAPLILTRLALLFVGWFSQNFPPSADYPLKSALVRGRQFSLHTLLDTRGRWDCGWYMSIVLEGYHLLGDITTTPSNITFFPFYPLLVRLSIMWVPASLFTLGVVLMAGLIISNLLLLPLPLTVNCKPIVCRTSISLSPRSILLRRFSLLRAPHIDQYGSASVPRLAHLRGKALTALGRFSEAEAQLPATLRGAQQIGARPIELRIQRSLAKLMTRGVRHGDWERSIEAARLPVATLAHGFDGEVPNDVGPDPLRALSSRMLKRCCCNCV